MGKTACNNYKLHENEKSVEQVSLKVQIDW